MDSNKKSLTKTITFKLALIIIVVLLLLSATSYSIILNIVHDQTAAYNRTMAENFLDVICTYSSSFNKAKDENYTKNVNTLCQYLCQKNFAAYAFAYTVSRDNKHIKLLGIAERENVGLIEQLPEVCIGKKMEYQPEKEELEMWEGKIDYIDYDSLLVDESIVSMCAGYDESGNRVVVGVGTSYVAIKNDAMNDFIPIILIITAGFIIVTICIYYIIRRSVLIPAKKIGDFMTAFIKDGNRTTEKLGAGKSYEFDIISSSLNKMTDDIDQYLENIRQLNEIQGRQTTELDIAYDIQQGFLAPNKYNGRECEIYAMMTPARNVGGDLYDYFTLEDGRILMTIADVSGKGISASMYMAVTLVFIHQLASSGCSPSEILRQTNNIISNNNKYMLFITAFVGIYNPENGELVYSNAGHLPPCILRNKPEFLTGAKNLVLGLYYGESYTEDKTKLNVGDILFLYTDGVTEAIDENKHFFGDERLKTLLDGFRPSHEENIVEYVTDALKNFMNGSEQFDDITMLSCTVKHHTELELLPDRKEFDKIKQAVLASKLPRTMQLSLCVAAEEIFINICSYAFEKSEGEKKIRFVFEHSDRILMRFEDNGIEYNPTTNVSYDDDYDIDNQLGGLGKLIAFTIADKVYYEYTDNKNILTIIKYLMEG